ncbi:acyltransferase [Yaniella halotolerans]|uniref:acyltransferase n=1 Tax=Yaniella halotolerans TaxID=225453 RepID=UPI00049674D4|nr:acyltransferase [Yaniella halotolerans]
MSSTRVPRNVGIDLLRVFSIVMVVVGHAGSFPNDQLLTVWRMPLFFMLSGFFFTPGRSLTSEFTKRWNTLIIPYLAWSVVISVWVIMTLWGQPETFFDHLQSGWAGGSGQSIYWMAAWFITTLAGATILRRFLERFGSLVPWIVATAGIVVAYVLTDLVNSGALDTHPLVDTPLRLGLAWPVMFYLLVGELLHSLLMPLVKKFTSHVLALVGIALVGLGLYTTMTFDISAHYIQAGGFGTPVLTPLIAIIVTVGFILVFATWVNDVLQKFPSPQAAVSRLVRTGTPVVFIHGLALVWMYQNGFGEDSFEHFGWRVLVGVVASFLVALLINSAPTARLLSGAAQEPNVFRKRGGLPS